MQSNSTILDVVKEMMRENVRRFGSLMQLREGEDAHVSAMLSRQENQTLAIAKGVEQVLAQAAAVPTKCVTVLANMHSVGFSLDVDDKVNDFFTGDEGSNDEPQGLTLLTAQILEGNKVGAKLDHLSEAFTISTINYEEFSDKYWEACRICQESFTEFLQKEVNDSATRMCITEWAKTSAPEAKQTTLHTDEDNVSNKVKLASQFKVSLQPLDKDRVGESVCDLIAYAASVGAEEPGQHVQVMAKGFFAGETELLATLKTCPTSFTIEQTVGYCLAINNLLSLSLAKEHCQLISCENSGDGSADNLCQLYTDFKVRVQGWLMVKKLYLAARESAQISMQSTEDLWIANHILDKLSREYNQVDYAKRARIMNPLDLLEDIHKELLQARRSNPKRTAEKVDHIPRTKKANRAAGSGYGSSSSSSSSYSSAYSNSRGAGAANRMGNPPSPHTDKKACYQYRDHGYCSRGDTCIFSHGDDNRRNKREGECRNWRATGQCRFGDGCLWSADHIADSTNVYRGDATSATYPTAVLSAAGRGLMPPTPHNPTPLQGMGRGQGRGGKGGKGSRS
jgi:hypothetical protein